MRWTSRVAADPLALSREAAPVFREFLAEVRSALEAHPWPVLVDLPADRAIQVVGDIHGDYVALASALKFRRERAPPDRFVALGDYVDRATRSQPDPASLPGGSLWTVAHLLAWAAEAPSEVIPLMGNHESCRRLPVPGPTFFREIRRVFGPEEALTIYPEVMDLLERLPLAARTGNGVFLAHGGIPPHGSGPPDAWRRDDLALLEGLLWADPEVGYQDRGIGTAYSEDRFRRALDDLGCRMMVKGHAPHHSGVAIFGGRLLTLHTSDLYAGFGHTGILMAEIPPIPEIRSARDLRIRRVQDGSWQPYSIRWD